MNQSFFTETLQRSDHNFGPKTPFRERKWRASIQQSNESTDTFWRLRSNVSYFSFIECKKLELFFIGLPETELQMLYDAPGVLTDDLFIDLLKAQRFLQMNSETPEVVLLQRLAKLQAVLKRTIWNKNLLYTLQGNLKYELLLQRAAIRTVNKFNGWVRNSSAVGSKSKSRVLGYEPETPHGDFISEEIDYFSLLISPELDSFNPGLLDFKLEELSYGSLEYINLINKFEHYVNQPS